jgi:hypothetical protein
MNQLLEITWVNEEETISDAMIVETIIAVETTSETTEISDAMIEETIEERIVETMVGKNIVDADRRLLILVTALLHVADTIKIHKIIHICDLNKSRSFYTFKFMAISNQSY